MNNQNSIRDMFFEESEELIEALTEGLSVMNAGQHNDETVNAVFRAVHSIKGGAGAFKLTELVAFAHRFETVLDELRGHRLQLGADVMHILQRSADHLADLLEHARTETPVDEDQTVSFLAALDACLGDKSHTAEEEPFSFDAVPISFDLIELDTEPAAPPKSEFVITFYPKKALFANGHEPALLIAALADLGPLSITLDLSRMPEFEDFDPADPFIGWTIVLTTGESETSIHEVFEFVIGLCDLSITPKEPQVVMVPVTLTVSPEPRVEQPASRAPESGSAQSTENRGPKPTLRVDLDRVDRLINAVGELIINQSMIAQRLEELNLASDADVISHVEDYRLLARDIQEAVMAIRAQPVKSLFQRMSRIVREAADSVGKTAQLITSGEGVEVDKTLVERLADPLTHMIRNAVDHGLETPEARQAAGKAACGSIFLSAAHRSGSVVITVRDDGAGLNRPKILDIARKKNLIPIEADPNDAEIDALLFLPGFSTASSISNLSGRGVGLDVVRNAVMALGGRIAISSTPGKGTEFNISVPLTLAVLDGMLVSVAGQIAVVPIVSILETVRPEPGDVHLVGTDDCFLAIRDQFVPMVDVAKTLGFAKAADHSIPQTLLLIETENQGQCALIVDRVFDQRQVVIKGLESNYGSVLGVSAATVLGDGQVALILDPEAIAQSHARSVTDFGFTTLSNEGKRLGTV